MHSMTTDPNAAETSGTATNTPMALLMKGRGFTKAAVIVKQK